MLALNLAHIKQIDSFPVYHAKKEVLVVGTCSARIDYYLCKMGFKVWSTDIERTEYLERNWEELKGVINFSIADIFDLKSFPIESCEVVLCTETLEHLKNYKKAIPNLLKLTETRLIISVPYQKSYLDPGHVNFWSDTKKGIFKDINEFHELCKPYLVTISKIRTKPRDVEMGQWDYLIVVDKRQKYGF